MLPFTCSISSDLGSKTQSGLICTWMGDHLGEPGAVDINNNSELIMIKNIVKICQDPKQTFFQERYADGQQVRDKFRCGWGCEFLQLLGETVWRVLRKLETELPREPATPLLGRTQRKSKHCPEKVSVSRTPRSTVYGSRGVEIPYVSASQVCG